MPEVTVAVVLCGVAVSVGLDLQSVFLYLSLIKDLMFSEAR